MGSWKVLDFFVSERVGTLLRDCVVWCDSSVYLMRICCLLISIFYHNVVQHCCKVSTVALSFTVDANSWFIAFQWSRVIMVTVVKHMTHWAIFSFALIPVYMLCYVI